MTVRLQVVLARAGIASRRKAEAMIAAGRVSLNGRVAALGDKAGPGDDVRLDGAVVGPPEDEVVVALHKPDAVVSTLSDPEGRRTVADLVDKAHSLRPVGRLDYHTEGLLLMSNHGPLVHQLLHPRFDVPKTYLVRLHRPIGDAALRAMAEGVVLPDGRTRPAFAERVPAAKGAWIRIIVNEGRNRLIRRMCEQLGLQVRRLIRTDFAGIQLGGLRPGMYRYLSLDELSTLARAANFSVEASPAQRKRAGQLRGRPERGRGDFPGRAAARPS